MLFEQRDFNLIEFGRGTEGDDIMVAATRRQTLSGMGGYDVLLGSSGGDVLNAGEDGGYILAGEGDDRIYIDTSTGSETLEIDLRDWDNQRDVIFFGNDVASKGEKTLGVNFVDVYNFGEEDLFVIREFSADDFYYTIPVGDNFESTRLFINIDGQLNSIYFHNARPDIQVKHI